MGTQQTALFDPESLNETVGLETQRTAIVPGAAVPAPVSIDTRMLKVGEAAKAIGVHKRTVYDWIEKGLVETRFLPSGVTLVVMASVIKTARRAAQTLEPAEAK